MVNGVDAYGGGVGGSGGGGRVDALGEEAEVLKYLESGMGRDDAKDVELLLNTERYSAFTCKKIDSESRNGKP